VDFNVVGTAPSPSSYVAAFRDFLDDNDALADGTAHSTRSIGLLEQPLYPSGVPGSPPGPLSPPLSNWSLFNTGLELDLIYNRLAQSIGFYLNQVGLQTTLNGAAVTFPNVGDTCTDIPRIANGITLFPGGFPIYKNGQLVGGIGASGDGSDQSDLVAFLGLANAAKLLAGPNNAPPAIRADNLTPNGVRLLYVQCPQAPFNNSNEQFVCEGL
jgi:hypothetical protein